MSLLKHVNNKNNSITHSVSLKEIIFYFFKLGMVGFGGAIIMMDKMHKELVERKKWVTETEFKNGIAFTQFTPGPLVTLLSTYIGFLKLQVIGAIAAWASFITPAFIATLIISILYVHFGNLPWMQGALYGVGAAIIGVITSAVYRLFRKTVNTRFLLGIAIISFIFAFLTKQTNFIILVAGGLINLTIQTKKLDKFFVINYISNFSINFLPASLQTNIVIKLFIFFFIAGSVAFGGGLAILPFIQSGVVYQYHLITEKQFLDGVAVAMMTPGPIVIIAVFIGYLVAGFSGAIFSGLGIFLPVFIIANIFTPFFKKHGKNPYLLLFIDGVVAAALGAVFSSIIFLAKGSVIDVFTGVLAIGGFIAARYLKIPIVFIVFIAGLLGYLVHH